MSNTSRCSYAHGDTELITPLCRYDENCLIVNCNFIHSIINGRNGRYDLEDFIYKNIKNKKNKNKSINFSNSFKVNNIVINRDTDTIISKKLNNTEEKEFFDKNNINVLNNDINKYYLDIIKKLNNKIYIYKKEINKYNNSIINLKIENNNLKNKNNVKKDKRVELKSSSINTTKITLNISTQTEHNLSIPLKRDIDIQTDDIPNEISSKIIEKKIDLDSNYNKKLIKYNKWIKIYSIFNKCNFNYNNIDINSLKQYVKDKNLYKIKKINQSF
jgi:hypothetical protein